MSIPEGAFEVKLAEVYLPGRFRKDLGDIVGLQKSIDSIEKLTGQGLIHPIVVSRLPKEDPRDKPYVLVAGGRRVAALLLSGKATAPATLRTQVSDYVLRTMELEENLGRKEMTWTEQTSLVAELDRLKREEHGEGSKGPGGQGQGWTQGHTASLIGQDKGHVSKQIAMAKALREDPSLKAKLQRLPFAAAFKQLGQLKEEARLKRLKDSGRLATNSSLQHMDALEGLKALKKNSVDLLLTDPPFGDAQIEAGTAQGKSRDSVVYQQKLKPSDNMAPEQVREMMYALTPELFRVLKPGAHVYVFHTFSMRDVIYDAFFSEGFIPDAMPLIWDKGKPVSVFTGYNYPSCYEPILFGHKPPRIRRLKTPARNILTVPPINPDSKVHPFQKPRKLLQALIENSSHEGELVLDPFAGSGSTLRTAQRLGRSGLGFELDEENYLRAQAFLTKETT